MSKKKLILNEAVTRRFMRLAEIESKFTDEFLTELDDEMDMEMGPPEDEMPGDEGPEEEMPPEEPMGDTVEVDAEELVSDIVAALQKQGADVSMEGGEEEAPEGEEMEPVAGDEELPPEEEEEPLMQELADNVTITSDEDMVNEVARRVAARLVAAAKARK
tara:strand:- start:734 stop:1216 length:483 start_codon:yes stop_codon:yes gene_type:complete